MKPTKTVGAKIIGSTATLHNLPHVPNAATAAALGERPKNTFPNAKAVLRHLRRGY